ncbi:conserved protein of unknown function [Candidatus Nitrosocosmicus franklandus]|uniref:Uncharacterized protein n=2 Tax=Candidatus Nitrosocosmicus franklandianus TaxID=1798806 RepID=A0A484IEH7_9ARCH|nr:conserved protein of unknown function [Candidatus Nitrosocosmicus franklandus]
MKNLNTVLVIALLMSGLLSIGQTSNWIFAIPSDLLNHKYVFGPLVGITENDTGNVDWVLTGNWRSILTNDVFENTTYFNQSSGSFKAAIEMIKPDGTGRHTHTLTEFVVLNATQDPDNNSTIFNGTSTISLSEGPVVEVPTTIERSSNGNIFIVTIDPESVDYHFGNSSLIYGISANPKFINSTQILQ